MNKAQRPPGYSKRRVHGNGRVNWTALYLVAPPKTYLSVGTFDTKVEADAAWQEKVSERRRGLISDPRKGRMTFEEYGHVFLSLMTHQKFKTQSDYRERVTNEFVPVFGARRLDEISAEHIARWIRGLRDRGLKASTIRTYKAQLSGLLTTAVDLGYIPYNPCLKVKTPKDAPRRIKSASGPDIAAIMANLPGPVSTMTVHVKLQSGCRWGEVAELRPRDVHMNPDDAETVFLRIQRAMADVGLASGTGNRFVVENTTKGGEDRDIGLSRKLSTLLVAYIKELGLGPDDLLFPLSRLKAEYELANPEPEPHLVPIPSDLGRTDPNAAGRTYAHGTISGHRNGGCKCQWCRQATANYRADRRARGLTDRDLQPKRAKPRAQNLTDHCPDDWFRRYIWKPALEAAEIDRNITLRDLRHTHATWLARSGRVSVQVLKERMGHKSLVTTQRYIDDADVIETESADLIDDILSGAQPANRRLRAI